MRPEKVEFYYDGVVAKRRVLNKTSEDLGYFGGQNGPLKVSKSKVHQ